MKTFISHSRDDSIGAAALCAELERWGVPAFCRERDIAPGQLHLEVLERAIGESATALLMINSSVLSDRWFLDEYAALLTESTVRGMRLIPVLSGEPGDVPGTGLRPRPGAWRPSTPETFPELVAGPGQAPGVRLLWERFPGEVPGTPPAARFAGTRIAIDLRGLRGGEYSRQVARLATAVRGDPVPPDWRGPAPEAVEQARPHGTDPAPTALVPAQFVVTYARQDSDYGRRLVGWLAGAGLPAWSIADLAWGSRFVMEIRERLRRALAVIVVMTPAAEASEDVEREILESQRHGRELFPVLLHGERNFLLGGLAFFDARGGCLPGGAELDRLARIHRAHLGGGPTPAPAPEPARPALACPRQPLVARSQRRLRAILAEGDLAHADLLTTAVLLEAAGRVGNGWLDGPSARRLGAGLLTELDDAWSEATGARHGFTSQLGLHRVEHDRGADFMALTRALGWADGAGPVGRPARPRPIERYETFIDRPAVPAGFFPTLRNPQVEPYPAWYDRWRHTVLAVHLRLRTWTAERMAR